MSQSLCFHQSFSAFRSKKITEEEHLGNLIAHFGGVRHAPDTDKTKPRIALDRLNPYAEAIRCAAMEMECEALDDNALEIANKVFVDCLKGDTDSVQANLDKLITSLGERVAKQLFLQPLAIIAVNKGHSEIFKGCLERGAVFDERLDYAIQQSFYKYPVLKDVVIEAKWRNIQEAGGDDEKVMEVVRPWTKNKKLSPKEALMMSVDHIW